MSSESRDAVALKPDAGPSTRRPLLSISDLVIDAGAAAAPVRLVDGFNLSIKRGERVALVGESGSGKTVTARAIMRLDPAFRLGGSIMLDDQDLLTLNERQMTAVRGHKVGMVFQDPMS